MKVQEYYLSIEDQFKFYGGVMRLQTAILRNVQVAEKYRVSAEKLFVFPWETTETSRDEVLNDLSKEAFEENYKRFLGLNK